MLEESNKIDFVRSHRWQVAGTRVEVRRAPQGWAEGSNNWSLVVYTPVDDQQLQAVGIGSFVSGGYGGNSYGLPVTVFPSRKAAVEAVATVFDVPERLMMGQLRYHMPGTVYTVERYTFDPNQWVVGGISFAVHEPLRHLSETRWDTRAAAFDAVRQALSQYDSNTNKLKAFSVVPAVLD